MPLPRLAIPYKYIVGANNPSTPSGALNVNVILSMDPDFKKTVITVAKIATGGIAAAVFAGFVIREVRKHTK